MKIGIYGGAFDPLHTEHERIIDFVLDYLRLDKLILLLSYSPPHKKCTVTDFAIRKEMLETVADGTKIVIDDREFRRSDVGYSYITLAGIKRDYPADELVYIIGGDSMEKFHTWVKPEVIAKLVKIAVVGRSGFGKVDEAVEQAKRDYGADIEILPFEGGLVSSSCIKAAYEAEISSTDVSPAVHNIIKKYNLYSTYHPFVDELRNDLDEERFAHSVSTMLYAVRFCARLALNFDKTLVAALLHDCAKCSVPDERYADIPPKIVHQFQGADVARDKFGITDEAVLDAIRYHTTGKKDMTILGKLIYCADVLEPLRDYEGVGELRRIFEEDFERGFVACVKSSINKLQFEGKPVYFLSLECYNYYNLTTINLWRTNDID